MADTGLAREAEVFARYLADAPATPYVVERYAAGHVALPAAAAAGDDVVLFAATIHPALTRVADAYARVFAPRSLLRHKLVLLLAILESSPGTHQAFALRPASPVGVVLRLAASGAAFALSLVVGVVLIGPRHLLGRIAGGGR